MKRSVLFITQNLPVPQVRRTWMEAVALKSQGWEVSVISPRKKEQSKKEIASGINLYRYREIPHPGNYWGYLLEYSYSIICSFLLALKIFFIHRFSIIHIANPPDLLIFPALFFKIFGVKIVYDQYDLCPELFLGKFKGKKNHPFYKILLFLETISLKFCDLHIATCKTAQKVALKRNNFKAPSVIVRNAVFWKRFSQKEIDKRLLAKTKKFKQTCVYVGVMGLQDGLQKLIKSIYYIVKVFKRNDVGFVLLGSGDELPALKKMVKQLGLDNNVIFTGWANGKMIKTYLACAQVGLMPDPVNEHSTNSLHCKVVEYMTMGLPFVVYDLKETRKTARKSAIFIQNEDEKDFAKSVIHLLDNKALRKEMGEYGKKRVRTEKYTWKDASKNLINCYETLLLGGDYIKENFFGEEIYRFKYLE